MLKLRPIAFLTALGLTACAPGLLRFPPTPAGPAQTGALVLKREQPPVPADRESVRFVVVGDAGRMAATPQGESRQPHPYQQEVAGAIEEACKASACDFTLLLGDNLYEKGIGKGDQAVLEGHADLAMITGSYPPPVYMVLGNHDWHSVLARHATADRELEWIGSQPEVRGNAHFYDFLAGPIHFWGLDTNYLVRRKSASEDPALAAWMEEIAAADDRWKIVLGHHEYLGNANHGNAGSYRDGLRFWPGKKFKRFLERHVLATSDLYLAGHEHTLQFYVPGDQSSQTAATAVIGSGAKCTEPKKRPANPVRTGITPALQYHGLGFAIVEVDRDRLTIDFYEVAGKLWSAWRPKDGDWHFTPMAPTSRCPPKARRGQRSAPRGQPGAGPTP